MQEQYLLEETVGKQDKKAVVFIGRFQPATKSHFMVIDFMKKFERLNKGVKPIVVVVAGAGTSKDTHKNPLSAADRISYMSNSGLANGIKFIQASSAFAAFEEVRKAGYEPYAIAAGSDRAEKYLELLDKYFKDENDKTLPHVIMPGLETREDPDDETGVPSEDVLLDAEKGGDIPTSMISGTMARLAVKLGLKKAFAKILGVNQKLADSIFNKIQDVLNTPEPEPEKKIKTPKTKV